MDAERLESLKAYMIVEGDDDNKLIEGFYSAAIIYLQNAGVEADLLGDIQQPLYDLVVNGLVLNDYDNREPEASGAISAIDFGLRRKINQLKGFCDVARAASTQAGS